MARLRRHHTHQFEETDCGPACVRTVLSRHGILVDLAILRESIGTGQQGASLLTLRESLASYGADTELLNLNPEQLAQAVRLAGPAIIQVELDENPHFVVVHAVNRKGDFIVSDPMLYRPRVISRSDLAAIFLGPTLITDRVNSRPRFRSGAQSLRTRDVVGEILRERKRVLAGILVLTVVVSLVALAIGVFLQVAVDRLIAQGSMNIVSLIAVGFIVGVLFSAGLGYVRGRMIVTLGQSMQRQFSERYVKKLLSLPLSFHRNRRTGDLVSRLDDVQELQALVAMTTVQATIDAFIVIMVGGYLLYSSPLVFGILMIPTAVNVYSSYALYPSIREAAEEALQRDATLKAEAFNVLHNYEDIASYGKRGFAFSRISRNLERRIASETRLGRLENVNSTIKMANMGAFTIFIAWIGLLQVDSGKLSIGQVFAFFALAGYFMNSMESLTSLQVTLQRMSVAVGRYRDIILQKSQTPPDGSWRADSGSLSYGGGPVDLDVRNLGYSYPATRGATVSDVNLKLPAGSAGLLQGANGSGKSTVLKLAAGLLPDYTGSVHLSGTDIRELDESFMRRHILYVSENPVVFSASLRENLTLGGSHEDEEIMEACRVASFAEIIDTLPQGLDTVMREDDAGLSRGQLQRMGLARAVLHAPAIYLFDESFSGVDRVTFEAIWRNLRNVEATKLVVSHDELDFLDFDVRISLD
ncbi:peptidase domain-containing ABC transporter [Streptomyces sp. NPDC059037]|uniref:peptidase domain-containing ABC transporter n=1 Tax=Streptomyces sp. NPDC059037 TaxID=3346710 RepID=UPI0036B6DB2D